MSRSKDLYTRERERKRKRKKMSTRTGEGGGKEARNEEGGGGGGIELARHGMRNSRWLSFDVFIRSRGTPRPAAAAPESRESIHISAGCTVGRGRVPAAKGPPKNQIECKNRINSSPLAEQLCCLRGPEREVDHLPYFLVFRALLRRVMKDLVSPERVYPLQAIAEKIIERPRELRFLHFVTCLLCSKSGLQK